MVESERQATQSLRKRLRASGIAASRAALKQGYGFLKRQHIKRDLISHFAPVREPRRDEHARPSGWQKVCYVIWRGDVVVDEEPSRALFCQSAQRSLRRLLNISFFCRCCTQRHSKARKSTQEPRARLGRTPTHTRIEIAVAVRILNGQRSLAHTAHALHCRATYDACVTAAGLSCIRMASSRSSSSARPVKLAMRGGTPMNGRGGGGAACDWRSAAAMMRRLRSCGSGRPRGLERVCRTAVRAAAHPHSAR